MAIQNISSEIQQIWYFCEILHNFWLIVCKVLGVNIVASVNTFQATVYCRWQKLQLFVLKKKFQKYPFLTKMLLLKD